MGNLITLWIWVPPKSPVFDYARKEHFNIMYNINQISNYNKTIHDDYENLSCSVFLDSGGFQIKNSNFVLDVSVIKELVEKINKKKPDLCLPLDFPQNLWSPLNVKKKMWSMTFKSLKLFLKFAEEYSLKSEIIPVIHGYSQKAISKAVKNVMALRDWNKIALGGQVGLLRKMYFVPNLGKLFCKNVKTLRDTVGEDVWIHVLGGGGMRTLPLIAILGANSGDSSGWEISASYGRIIVPIKGGAKYLPLQKREPMMNKNEIKLFNECNCPICQKVRGNKMLLFSRSKKLRLIHNFFQLFSLEKELNKVCEESDLLSWVKERYEKSSIWPIFEYSMKISRNNQVL